MATINSLRAALTTPVGHFQTLTNLSWQSDTPIVRSTHFAESIVTIGGCKARILMPLTPVALQRIERVLPLKLHLQADIVPPLTLLRNEMCICEGDAQHLYCDILLEPTIEGTPFDVALSTAEYDSEYAAGLLTALNRLEAALKEIDISLNNLREENLVLDNAGILRPVRWYYASRGAGADAEAFDSLRSRIATLTTNNQMMLCDIDKSPYNTSSNYLAAYLQHQPMSEGLIAVQNEQGWGFINTDEEVVIAFCYDWVGAFREGRAEVKVGEKMGLIDKRGEYVIPPIYDIVDYDHTSGNSSVRYGDEWALFNYLGEQISPFSPTRKE